MAQKFLDIANFNHLIGPTSPGTIELIEDGLSKWDNDTEVPSKIALHNSQNEITVAAGFNKDMVGITPADTGGSEFLVKPNVSHGNDTRFVIQMGAPAVSRLSRVELALRYLIRNALH